MGAGIEKRIAALECSRGRQNVTTSNQDQEFLDILVSVYYGGVEVQLTPEQERKLEDTVQWYRDEGLSYLLECL